MSHDHPHTRVVHPHPHAPGDPLSEPIHTASTWSLRSADEGAALSAAVAPERFYTRWGNPTVAALEGAVAALEGADGALAFASGMGAVSAALLAAARAGDTLVVSSRLYGGTAQLVHTELPTLGITTRAVDLSDPARLEAAIDDRTRVVYLESPSNPVLGIVDLAAVAAIARARGVLTIVDNTVATPWCQRPLEHGVDVVVHSATKALGGHSDVVAGVVAGPADYLERLWRVRTLFGACLSPHDAWLVLRGTKTLGVRQERATATALSLARWLSAHPAVRAVHYPGLTDHPGHAVAARQMRAFGSMLSFDLDDRRVAARVVERVRVLTHAVSLGGVESLIVHPASTTHRAFDDAALAAAGIAPGQLRVSVGLEDPADLEADLAAALEGHGA